MELKQTELRRGESPPRRRIRVRADGEGGEPYGDGHAAERIVEALLQQK
ncbi:MAG: hypothetical protein U0X92_00440 [Anaerolineales bacterium]